MKNKRILIIDDDIPLTRITRINLEDTGLFEVMIENESTRAISTAKEFRPDVVLLDVIMPGLDGGDIKALFKRDPYLRDIPVILVTALVSNTETGDGSVLQSGDGTMMAKPFRFDELMKVIEDSLAHVFEYAPPTLP